MRKYRNLNGGSGVLTYETGNTFIRVRFVNEDVVYTYNYASTGKVKVETMKKLADSGRGLSAYISRFVKKNYAFRTGIED